MTKNFETSQSDKRIDELKSQRSVTATADSIAVRGVTGTLKAADAVEDDDLVTLLQRTQLNQQITRALKAYNQDDSSLNLMYDRQGYIDGDETTTFDLLHTLTRATSKYVFNERGVLVEVPAGQPAFSYDPLTGEALGIDIEGSRTNYNPHSTNFDSVSIVKRGVTLTDTGQTVFGGLRVLELREVDGASIPRLQADFAQFNTINVSSWIAKAGDNDQFRIRLNGAIATTANFDLTSGVASFVTADSGNIGVGMKHLGDGWYLCWYSGAVGGGVSHYITQQSSTGSSTRSILLAEYNNLEVGSFPTSYIPTAGTTVTRAADICTIENINASDWWNPNEGTFVVEFDVSRLGDVGIPRILGTQEDAGSVFISAPDMALLIDSRAFGGSLTSTPAGLVNKGINKIAISLSSQGLRYSVNGSVIYINAGLTASVITLLRIGSRVTGDQLNGTISQLLYQPKAVSDTELQELSAL